MPDSIMFQQDAFVVLEPNRPEQFLTASELSDKLEGILTTRQDSLPPDVRKFTSVESQVQYLLDTACELDVGPGQYLQWYAVRLEKN